MKPNEHKLKMTFLMLTDLRAGAGTESFMLNLIKRFPKDLFDITILQRDYIDRQRIEERQIEEITRNVHLKTIKNYDEKFKFLFDNPIGLLFSRFVINNITSLYVRLFKNRAEILEAEKSDIIYLFYNENYRLFRSPKGKIYGSNHTSFVGTDSLLSKIQFKLLALGLIYPGIDGFHLFPSNTASLGGLMQKPILSLPTGVDTEIFYPAKSEKKGVIKLLFVGRLEKCKGIETLIELSSLLQEDLDFEMHIVGSGPYSNKLLKLNLKNFQYHGSLSPVALASIYRASDIFIYPSNCDVHPVVILEALSSGLYVIASNFLRGVFDDFEESGFLEYCATTGEEFMKRLNIVKTDFKNNKGTKSYADRQHRFVKENYDWKIIAKKFFEYFKGQEN